jgi:homoserine kinase
MFQSDEKNPVEIIGEAGIVEDCSVRSVKVNVPATTANLGPGFDCLGLALDLWNETIITAGSENPGITISGEGVESLPRDHQNLIVQSMARVSAAAGKPLPDELRLECINRIPISAGLGSSAAAILTGMLGANKLLGSPLSDETLLALAIAIEGHPDNLTAAFYGGLTVSVEEEGRVITRKFPAAALNVSVVLPEICLSTAESRDALPEMILLSDAVYNLGRTVLAVEAFKSAELGSLYEVLDDRLHQSFRLPFIPGGAEALAAAREKRIPAVLSGAGPALIAFSDDKIDHAVGAMQQAFYQKGINSRVYFLSITADGASCDQVIPDVRSRD